jgi:hypothetical protein
MPPAAALPASNNLTSNGLFSSLHAPNVPAVGGVAGVSMFAPRAAAAPPSSTQSALSPAMSHAPALLLSSRTSLFSSLTQLPPRQT